MCLNWGAHPINIKKSEAVQMIALYNFFFLLQSRFSSSFYPPIIFLWGRYAEEEKEAMMFECLKCAVVATPATPSSLLSLCGFPFLSLVSHYLCWCCRLDQTTQSVASTHHGFDLLRNTSRFPPLGRVPSRHVLQPGLTILGSSQGGLESFHTLKPGQDHSGFQMNFSSQARGDYFLIDMFRFNSIQHSKFYLAPKRYSKKGKTFKIISHF